MPCKTTPLNASQFSREDRERLSRMMANAERDGECIKLRPWVKGYAQFRSKKKRFRAHRVAYAILKGPIPEGLFVCHSCDTRNCVNPDHLWLGTPAENSADASKKGRMKGGKKGGRGGRIKFSKDVVDQIRSGGVTAREATARFGMSGTHFYHIKNATRRK